MQTHCLSLLGVEGAHSPQAFPFTAAEAPGPWHSPLSILIPLSITSRSHRTPGISMPRAMVCLQRALAALLSIETSLFDFQPPSPLCFPFPTSSLCFPLPSPQSGCLFLGFHLKQERAKSASKSCPRHCCRMWGLQGTSHTHTHGLQLAANGPAAPLEQSCGESPALGAVFS